MSHNPDLITLRNCQYSKRRRSRAVKRIDIQTLIKVDGGSNPNSFFFSFFLFGIRLFHSPPWQSRHNIVTAQMPKRSFEIPMTFASGRRTTESGERKSINSNRTQQKVR